MNKKLLLILPIMLLILVSPVFSLFTKTHNYYILKGFEEVDSPITRMCADKINLVTDGQTAADIGVIHYFDRDKDFFSYIFTHSRNFYTRCIQEAGSDQELQCWCIGAGLHQIMDDKSHNEDGLVTKYLKSEFASNLLGHMTVENDFELKILKLHSNENIISSGKLDTLNQQTLYSMFPDKGGNDKYFQLMQTVSNIDFRFDGLTFRKGYLDEGFSFYNNIYKDKVSLPWWFNSIFLGAFIIGVAISFVAFFKGKTKWKYIVLAEGLLIILIGGGLLYSAYTTPWKITTALIEIPASLGYLSVSNEDVVVYDRLIQTATNSFLTDGILKIDDVSGRTYYDRNGEKVIGALNEAEKPFKYILLPIIIIFMVILNFIIFRKSFRTRR